MGELRERLGADDPAGAGAVLDHHRFPPVLRHPLPVDPGESVGGAAGRERHDDPHRARGVVGLGVRERYGRREREQGEEGGKTHGDLQEEGAGVGGCRLSRGEVSVHNHQKIVNNLSPQVHDALRLGTIPGVQMATKRTTRARRTASEGEIHEAVLAALLDGRLPAGTPLREQHLAAMFGATRGRARKVLMHLGHEGRLELIPNRGAFVPTPSLADARRVFAARRVLEAGIVATLAQGIVKRDLEKLRKHLDAERRAAAAGAPRLVKLSAAFHTLLGQVVGNAEIAESLSSACSSPGRAAPSSRSTSRRRSPTARRPSTSRSSRRSPPATSSGRSRS